MSLPLSNVFCQLIMPCSGTVWLIFNLDEFQKFADIIFLVENIIKNVLFRISRLRSMKIWTASLHVNVIQPVLRSYFLEYSRKLGISFVSACFLKRSYCRGNKLNFTNEINAKLMWKCVVNSKTDWGIY